MRINGTQPLPQRTQLAECRNTGRPAVSEKSLEVLRAVILASVCVHLSNPQDIPPEVLENVRKATLAACAYWPELLDGTSLVVAMIESGDANADAARIL